ncbi:MAG TPA: GMC family oxidoreductase [Acidimicrobiia bacterium]|nr:GMC family oxidoreductase [Acidimicrobiia bacterium]
MRRVEQEQGDRSHDADVIVIGSGFGGSVSALRLTEKGYRVLVLEAGRRFGPDDFARSTWNLRRFLWFPRLGMRGIQRIDLLREVMVLSGAGVGGGSLVYANTLIEPHDEFFADRQWAAITDWKTELAPWYDQARRVLGVVEANGETAADRVVAAIARHFDAADTHRPVQVGVFRGEARVRVPDPFFGGIGPDCVGCRECGGCMVGCRHEAKNTVDRNYLYLAERGGARVLPEHEVVDLQETGDGWIVTTRRPGAWIRKRRASFRAKDVVFAGGGLGTTRLLLRLRDAGRIPGVSGRLGHLVRTNSEAVTGAVARTTGVDYSRGVAITSSFSPGPRTRIEPVRYSAGSNSMGLLATILVPGGKGWQPVRFLWHVLKSPLQWLRSLSVRRWSERGMIVLVMQSEDNSIRLETKRGLFRRKVTAKSGHGTPNPRWLPVAHEAARVAAEVMGGDPSASINESLLGIPLTAHLIGGATIGADPASGVVDPYHRMYGHPALSVVDGAAVPANLGSNPSLTITAMAERAMAAWPNKGEPDLRPAMGEPYRLVRVAPHQPIVPAAAPAALR